MAIRVIDFLEAIHVKHDKRDRQASAFGSTQFKIESFLQKSAIVQAGKRIPERLMAEYLPQAYIGERQSDLLRDGMD